MEQFYYTVCRDGKSVSGQNGFQIRALSPGLDSDTTLRLYTKYIRYAAPLQVSGASLQPGNTPVKLAYIRNGSAHLLTQCCWAGQDAEGRDRLGNFFAHAIVNLSDQVDALDALAAWGSPDWVTNDGDGPPKLPAAPLLPAGGKLNIDILFSIVSSQKSRKQLEFLISARIAAKPHQKLVIVGSSQQVAELTYALAACLPRTTRRQLTFSTYEQIPDDGATWIVGTCLHNPGADIDEKWYRDAGLAINLQTGRQSTVPASEYADWMLAKLAQKSDLSDIHAGMEKCGISEPAHLELIARVLSPKGKQPPSEVVAALSVRAVADRALESEAFRSQLAAVVMGSDKALSVQALKSLATITNAGQLELLKSEVARAAFQAIGTQQVSEVIQSASQAWKAMPCPGVSGSTVAAVVCKNFLSLGASKPPPALPVRLEILQWWNADPAVESDPDYASLATRWLNVNESELPAVFQSGVGNKFKCTAAMAAIKSAGDISALILKLLKSQNPVREMVFAELCNVPPMRGHAAALYVGMIPSADSSKVVSALLSDTAIPAVVFEAVLSRLKQLPSTDFAGLVLPRLGELLSRIPDSPSLAATLNPIVMQLSAGDVCNGRNGTWLEVLLASQLPLDKASRSRAEKLILLKRFLEIPSPVKPTDCSNLNSVLAETGAGTDVAIKAKIVGILCNSVADSHGLETFLLKVGNSATLIDSEAALLREMNNRTQGSAALLKNLGLVQALCMLSLGGSTNPVLNTALSRHSDLSLQAINIARVLPRNGFAALEKAALKWPATARTNWNRYLDLIRPRPFSDRVRDVIVGTMVGIFVGLLIVVIFGFHGLYYGGGLIAGLLLILIIIDVIQGIKNGKKARKTAASAPRP